MSALALAKPPAGYDEYRDPFPMDGRILDAGITATVEQGDQTGRMKGKISASELIDGSFINLLGKSSVSRVHSGETKTCHRLD